MISPAAVLDSLAIGTTVLWFSRRLRARGIAEDAVLSLALGTVVGGLVGAFVAYRVLAPSTAGGVGAFEFANGASSWGVLAGAAMGALASSRLARTPVQLVLDAGASVYGIGEAVARIGCFVAGDDFGTPTSGWWGVRWPAGSPAFRAQVSATLIPPSASSSLPVHPLQLYLAASALVAFVVASIVWRQTRRPLQPLSAFLLCYGVLRGVAELTRAPAAGGRVAGMSAPEWLCVACVVGALSTGLHRLSSRMTITRRGALSVWHGASQREN